MKGSVGSLGTVTAFSSLLSNAVTTGLVVGWSGPGMPPSFNNLGQNTSKIHVYTTHLVKCIRGYIGLLMSATFWAIPG